MTRRTIILTAAVIVLLVGALLARGYYTDGTHTANVSSGILQERIVTRAVVVPAAGTAKIRPRVGGTVRHVYVREGDHVEAGQVMAEIADETLETEVARRSAEHRQAQALARTVEEGLREGERSAIEAQLEVARHERALADDRRNRFEDLWRDGITPEQTVVEAREAYRVAEARLAEAEARAQVARSGGRASEREEARERVRAAAAALAQARESLSYGTLRAPGAGVVVARYVDPGDTIVILPSSEPTAFEVADPSEVELLIEVEEFDAGRIALDLPVTITPPGGGPAVGHGRIRRVAQRMARRRIGSEDGRLRADSLVRAAWCDIVPEAAAPQPWPIGQRLEASIIVASHATEGLVPRETVSVRDGKAYVRVPGLLVDREVAVILGRADDRFVQVQGIAQGAKVRIRDR